MNIFRAASRSKQFAGQVSLMRLLRPMCGQSRQWKVNMLYDSECPLCMHEIRFLEGRNKAGLVKFTDIAHPEYKPEENGCVGYEEGMKRIHAVMDDGSVISGVPVFPEVYKAVGLGWVWAVTQWPGVAWGAEKLYGVWAGWRMKITGREELEEIFIKRRKILAAMKDRESNLCNEKECKL